MPENNQCRKPTHLTTVEDFEKKTVVYPKAVYGDV